ncbi:L,D-transpeptidase [Tepidamorphus sp. 3E244]|uniref:L,D-transpeptidase n=1 Tax=Tepidamorphus sp. 3E244 TaxID=3385498 RepID=UPI0038FCBE7D
MRIMALLIAGLVAGFLTLQSAPAEAGVVAQIDISQQNMRVYVNGRHKYTWKVSTGRRGYGTPTGSYSIKRMHRTYYSKKYHGAAMPHSLFFRGGYAVHGTSYVRQLGRPASHGCVRLHPSNARTLFNLVRAHGAGSSRVVLKR